MPIPLGVLAVAGAGAAGGATGFDLLETTLLTSTTSSVTFSNLNTYTDYKHLQLRYTARHTANAGAEFLVIRPNADSSGIYYQHRLSSFGGNPTAQTSLVSTGIDYSHWVAGAGSVSNSFSAGIVDILEFSNTNKKRVFRGWSGIHSDTGNVDTIVTYSSGLWNSTNAITSLQLSVGSSYNFASGCRFSLYGMKG